MATEGAVVYSSNTSVTGSDGKGRKLVTKKGETLVIPAAAQLLLTGGNTISARDAMGIAGQVQEQKGEIKLGTVAPPVLDLELNDDTITDSKIVTMIANHAEMIKRHNDTITALIAEWNLFLTYARNGHTILDAPE